MRVKGDKKKLRPKEVIQFLLVILGRTRDFVWIYSSTSSSVL